MNLAHILVREMHGIRRFLYPLTAHVSLPNGTDLAALSLALPDGTPVPVQATHHDALPRLDFAVFLAPYEQLELTLSASGPQTTVNDPLRVDLPLEKVLLIGTQERFTVAVRHDALLRDVTYDAEEHTRGLLTITRNGRTAQTSSYTHSPEERAALSAWATAHSIYPDGVQATAHCELTACKSWATVTHTVQQPKAGDVLTFNLPLTVTALPLLCDFGMGGGVYGKIGAGDTVTWETEFTEEGPVQWTLSTNGRTDYAGTVGNRKEYHAQQWFHVIDKGKALAVTITRMPDTCARMTVTLNGTGDVQIAITLGETDGRPAEFGICYHFLNDAPAVAAATNPQSILLPPTVEVLPA